MAIRRSPIKVSCEYEDLPDIENAPDFDKDTLLGELCWASASVIMLELFLFHQFQEDVLYTVWLL